jgi:hypothetical protein
MSQLKLKLLKTVENAELHCNQKKRYSKRKAMTQILNDLNTLTAGSTKKERTNCK